MTKKWPAVMKFVTQNWMMVVIVLLATWLRVTELDTKAILFGDAGHDLLVAAQAVTDRQLPLLGIESSVPRFRQGPVTVWLEMVVFAVSGYRLLPFSLVFALISIAAVIGIYELVTVYGTKRQGVIAAFLLALSPLAIAHGRMVYHITPIPLMTLIFIWCMVRLRQAKPKSWFWAVLAWCLLFQFELALLPLVLLVPLVIWLQRQTVTRQRVIEVVAGFALGLAPQVIYDLTHGFKQLGGFAVWVGYRLVSAVSVVGEHAVGPSSLTQTARQVATYGVRIVSVDQPLIALVGLLIVLASGWICLSRWRRQTLEPLMEISWLAALLLAMGFAIHSSPSEAYFPVFCVLVPLLMSFPLAQVTQRFQPAIGVVLAAWGIVMIMSISRHGWFVGKSTGFAYGPSVGEQRQTIQLVRRLTNDDFQLATIQPGGKFANYFDNLRWMAKEVGVNEKANGTPVFIEPKNSLLTNYPTATKVELPTQDIYVYE